MKRMLTVPLCLFFICCCATIQGSAQGQTLTKGETISYINKMVKRAIGHNALWIMCSEYELGEIASSSFSENGETVTYSVSSYAYKKGLCSAPAYNYTYEFNPAYIKSITQTPIKNTSVVRVKINMKSKDLIKVTSNSGKGFTDKMDIFLFLAEPKNFDSFRKALLHLKDLVSAEEDPFGD